jgi:hypothetical protein
MTGQHGPESTFASNSPIEGVDLDGLEFMNFNDSYIKMFLNYDSKLQKVDAVTIFRLDEFQKGTVFEKRILPHELESRIKNTPSNCSNCIPSYDARVTSVEFLSPSDEAEMNDLIETPSSVSMQSFKMLKAARTKKEQNEVSKSKEFYTPGFSGGITKLEGKIAAIEALGIAGKFSGEMYLAYIVTVAKGHQSYKAADVLVIIQNAISNGGIPSIYQNNQSLSEMANFMLYGASIKDKGLETLAKTLWNDFETIKIKEEQDYLIKKETEPNKIDNTGKK